MSFTNMFLKCLYSISIVVFHISTYSLETISSQISAIPNVWFFYPQLWDNWLQNMIQTSPRSLAEVVKRIFSLSLRKFDLSCQNYFTIKTNVSTKTEPFPWTSCSPTVNEVNIQKLEEAIKQYYTKTYQLLYLEYQKVKHESNSVHMSDSAKVIYFLLSAENWTISCRPTNKHWLGIQGNYCGN